MTIEDALAKLEEITSRLEQAELPLEESIALFEEGLALATTIKTDLDKARLRIDQVIEKAAGTFELEPLEPE
jgi:exodeoxyribonuclease VII small subunit